jgi:hypothetical protein
MDFGRLGQNARSADRMRRRMAKTGFTPNGHPIWEPPERQHLDSDYPDYERCLPKNPRRTRRAHHAKAGVHRPS